MQSSLRSCPNGRVICSRDPLNYFAPKVLAYNKHGICRRGCRKGGCRQRNSQLLVASAASTQRIQSDATNSIIANRFLNIELLRGLLRQGGAAVAAFRDEPALLGISLVYLVQGLTDIAWLAKKFFLKDDLGASPTQVSLLLSLVGVPWMLKPLLGLVTDRVPLGGYRRRSYLLLASAAAAGSWLFLSLRSHDLPSALGAMLVGSGAAALSDVVVDSMVVERAREESKDSSGSLQSLCWSAFAVGQVATAAISGSMVQAHGPRYVFAVTAAFPVLIGAASLLVAEERVLAPGEAAAAAWEDADGADCRAAMEPEDAMESWEAPLAAVGTETSRIALLPPVGETAASTAAASSGTPSVCPTPAPPSATTASASITLSASSAAPPASFSAFPAASVALTNTAAADPTTADDPSAAPAPAAAAAAAAASSSSPSSPSLMSALTSPSLAWPVGFLVLLSATPAADDAVFFWQVEALGFTPAFLGGVQLAIAVVSLAGVWLYNSAFKQLPLRSFLLWGNLMGAALQCSDLLLVSRVNTWLGLDDHLFCVGGSVVTSVIANVLSMPTLVLAARLCPPGLEATMFATIMSLLNAAEGLRYAGGAALTAALGVGPGSYDNLPVLVGLCNAALLLPLPVLLMMPYDLDLDAELAAAEPAPQQGAAAVAAAGVAATATAAIWASADRAGVAGEEGDGREMSPAWAMATNTATHPAEPCSALHVHHPHHPHHTHHHSQQPQPQLHDPHLVPQPYHHPHHHFEEHHVHLLLHHHHQHQQHPAQHPQQQPQQLPQHQHQQHPHEQQPKLLFGHEHGRDQGGEQQPLEKRQREASK